MNGRAVRLRVVCLECEKKFSTSNPMPECPRCGGTDIELADDVGVAAARGHRAPAPAPAVGQSMARKRSEASNDGPVRPGA